MTKKSCIQLIGAGGHAKVVVDALNQAGYHNISKFDDSCLDVNADKARDADIQPLEAMNNAFPTIISIGSNHARYEIAKRFPNLQWTNAIHPSALVHPTAFIGKGVYIGARAIIQPYAVIGDHTIINTATIIEHDVEIGDYCHISPGNILTGGVRVGKYSFLGAGTTVIPNILIGDNVIIGAGSVVIDNIPSSVTAVGCPCKVIRAIN